MRTILCLVLLIIQVELFASLCLAQDNAPQDDIGRIAAALRSHAFKNALTLCEAALTSHPEDFRVWTLRGMATAGTGDLQLALLAYQHALQLAPSYLPALEGAAQSEFQLGHDAAKPLLAQILSQQPDDPTSNAMLAVLEYRGNSCAEAVTHFQLAAAVISSQPEALTEYGTCLANLHRDDGAVAAFSQALALDSSKISARYNLALAQFQAQHADDALATLRPLLEAVPVDPSAVMLAAQILELKGDTTRAVQLLRAVIVANPRHVDAYLQFAALSFDHESPQVGIDILNAGLTQLPQEPRLYLVRGILQTQLGEFTRAADDFETANRIDPHLSFLGEAEGLVKSQQHLSADALAKFRSAVKAHPNEAYAHYLLAEALQQEGAPASSALHQEQLEAAKRAAQLDPQLVAARDLLSGMYLDDGQVDLAIEQSRSALALDPKDQQAIYHLIVALRKTDQKQEVPALLKRLLALRSSTEGGQNTKREYRLYEATRGATGLFPQ